MRGWDGVFAAAFAAGFAMTCGCFGATAQEQPRSASACNGDTIAHGSASRIIDGRSFVLDDGREVRLAAIEVPPLPLSQEKMALACRKTSLAKSFNPFSPPNQQARERGWVYHWRMIL